MEKFKFLVCGKNIGTIKNTITESGVYATTENGGSVQVVLDAPFVNVGSALCGECGDSETELK